MSSRPSWLPTCRSGQSPRKRRLRRWRKPRILAALTVDHGRSSVKESSEPFSTAKHHVVGNKALRPRVDQGNRRVVISPSPARLALYARKKPACDEDVMATSMDALGIQNAKVLRSRIRNRLVSPTSQNVQPGPSARERQNMCDTCLLGRYRDLKYLNGEGAGRDPNSIVGGLAA